jgi:hypothetical protein
VFAVFAARGFAVGGSIKKSSKYIQTKYGFCSFRFGLIRFTVLLLVWFGYDHPLRVTQTVDYSSQKRLIPK